MTAFAKGIDVGTKVRQGQVIGFVGSSGMSTGSHVHFEIIVNDRFVDPMRIKLPRGRVLDGPTLAGFEKDRDQLDAVLSHAPVYGACRAGALMAPAGDAIEVQSSRLWATFHFNLTRWLFPARMIADRIGVSTNIVGFWLTPWKRVDEHLPLSHVAEVTHIRGFFWDAIWWKARAGSIRCASSACRRAQARYFVDHVRERLNDAALRRSSKRRGGKS